ncbi:MAG: fibronectin type III domain-containing protein, partial [Euryarchaeota archaeon]|nr:fibronectin type III domain-containing protein [Euryarchaeota archaeon]
GSGGGSSGSVPSAPLNLKATAGDGYVTLSWSAPSSNGGSAITEYKIYRGTSKGGEKYLAQVSGSTFTYKDTAVSNGVTYYYYVTAVNSVGESPKSNEVSATPKSSGPGKILFVDDDDGSAYSEYVEDALKDAGYTYDVWDVYQKGYAPSYGDLLPYKIVIWSTGYAYKNTITSQDQDTLIRYLDEGGRLYLSSQDFLWELTGGKDGSINNVFVNHYLGVSGVENDVGYTSVYGVSSSPITANMGTVELDYPYSNYDDELSLESGAKAIFTDSYGNVAGDSYTNGVFKTVFTAFSFEAVEKANPNVGAELMKNIITWLSS